MSIFPDFEAKALRFLLSKAVGPVATDKLVREAELVSYSQTDQGYKVVARHPLLETQSILCDTPLVIGRYENTEVRILVSINDGELCLECRSTNGRPVGDFFRERNVLLKVNPPIDS